MKQIKFEYKKTCLIQKVTIDSLLEKLEPEIQNASRYAFTYLPFDEENIKCVKKIVLEKQALNPTTLVVIGIGGSNLGTWAVQEAINGKLGNKVYFADTVDSDYINNIAKLIEQELIADKNVIFNVVSKSGTTIETIAIFEFFLSILKKYKPNNFNDYIVITTDQDSVLFKYAQDIKCSVLTISKNLGGRYSVLSAVGLFPLSMLGVNIQELLHGASKCDVNNAAISAALLYKHYKNGINIHDTFLFSVDLENLGKWYRQLMAESLGKDGIGITPTVSIGSTDLHSMVQLYLGGPIDKFTTFVTIENTNTEINEFSKIMNSIIKGTQIAYQKNNRPFCIIEIENKSEYNLGQFMQIKMYEIVFLGYLLCVNPFDQPNVEDYKVETKKILGK
ncbi:MAG: hypothetical protein P4L22_03045 [Candidatus Babeliales bacterium]|nr:hypothetical protein [Candidatus Babeliales bacterium]